MIEVVKVVGPRELPGDGQVRVRLRSGGGRGREFTVRVRDLRAATELDDGHGREAVYDLAVYYCRG